MANSEGFEHSIRVLIGFLKGNHGHYGFPFMCGLYGCDNIFHEKEGEVL